MTPRKTSRAPAAGPPVGAGKEAGRAPRHAPATPAGMIPIVPAGPGFPPVPSEEGSTGGSQKSGLPGRGNAVPGSPGIHMSERELENAIRRILADLPQVLWYHTRDSRRSPSGFPDLVCVGPGFVIYRELKTARGRVSAAQRRWLDALRDTGASAGVWRPSDLLSGTIARELARLAGIGRAR